jgi:hypothetical protein
LNLLVKAKNFVANSNKKTMTTFIHDNTVTREEIEYSLNNRPLLENHSLGKDFGEQDTIQILRLFTGELEKFKPCLSHPGVGTRFKRFYSFLKSLETLPANNREAFEMFAQHLGRVNSFRALALTPDVFESEVIQNNMIRPKGRLNASEDTIKQIVLDYGVRNICVDRLYYTHEIPHDASVSLHDDGETATLIASTFVRDYTKQKVFLMELSVPVVETIGYTIADIQHEGRGRFFEYQGVWFDTELETTERYVVYGIPFYRERLVNLRVFESAKQVEDYIAPFRVRQQKHKNEVEN